MTLDALRAFCRSLPAVTEDVKWGDDLVFSVAKKMFVAVSLEPPHKVGFKCTPDDFAELIERDGIIPAPYMARNHWVLVEELNGAMPSAELRDRVRASYDLVVARLPKKTQAALRPTARGRRS